MSTENQLETLYIKGEITKCDGVDDLRDFILPLLHTQQEQWRHKINEIIVENHISKTKLGELCEVTRVSVDKWCKGSIPKKRETFLLIGMAAGYDEEKINQLLQRYGEYPKLYVKNLEDCICMYVINHGYGDETIEKYKYIRDKIRENLTVREDEEKPANLTTEKFEVQFSQVTDEDSLERFIVENIAMFGYAYHHFNAYMQSVIKGIYFDKLNANSLNQLAESQNWSSSLKQCVSAIRQNKWCPTRNKIISLGIHLAMTHEEVNKVLKKAYMEPLCAKNIFESVIIFILEAADDFGIYNEENEENEQDGLISYAREVMEELDIPEVADFISELAEDFE